MPARTRSRDSSGTASPGEELVHLVGELAGGGDAAGEPFADNLLEPRAGGVEVALDLMLGDPEGARHLAVGRRLRRKLVRLVHLEALALSFGGEDAAELGAALRQDVG